MPRTFSSDAGTAETKGNHKLIKISTPYRKDGVLFALLVIAPQQTMPSKELNIIEFISELNLLQGAELSSAQAAILKATYGAELNQTEFEIYSRATGRKTYQPREHLEVTVIVGRQGGKTSRIGVRFLAVECLDSGDSPNPAD